MEKIPLFALSAASCIATSLVPETPADRFPFSLRFWNAMDSCVIYLWQMICPVNLAVPYLYPADGLSTGMGLLALALLLAISLGAIAGWRRRPYFVVGWLWYLGMLVPVLGFVQISYYAHADRYTYLPQIGLYILLAWGAVELCGSWRYRRAVLASAAAAILAALIVAAHGQTAHWSNNISLWTHTLACTSANHIAQNNLGFGLATRGQLTEAIEHYQQALQLKPGSVNVYNNLGDALADQGKWSEAIPYYELTIQSDPNNPKFHNNLGIALAARGNWVEAIPHYERALQLKPDYLEAHYNFGNILVAQGRLKEAIQHFEQALQLALARNNPALAKSISNNLQSLPPP